MGIANASSPVPPPRSRLVLGGGILVLGLLCPLFVPLVTGSTMPTAWKAALSGLLMLGIPELFMLVAVAVLGKPGYAYLKAKFFGLLRRHVLPPDTVSRTRYRIGTVMFLLPFLWGWLTPYVSGLLPSHDESEVALAVVGDVLVFASLLVLGGDFWDKLRSLFVHSAIAEFPPRAPD